MVKIKIVFVFRNGFQLCIPCEEFELEKTLGMPTGFSFKGLSGIRPLHINWDDVICVYRDLAEEQDETD